MMARVSESLRLSWLALILRPNMRPLRFLSVGILGVGVNTAVLWTATVVAERPAMAGGIAAAVVSTLTNFLLNDVYTWRDRRWGGWRAKGARLVRYYATTGGGNLIYLAVLTLLTRVGVPLLLANLAAIGTGGSFNYLIHNLWTWRRSERP